MRLGRLDEAEAAFRKDVELRPDHPGVRMWRCLILIMRLQPEAALEEIERETEPGLLRFGQALAYHALKRSKEADANLHELLKHGEVAAFQIADVYAFRGEADKAFEWLERSYVQRDGGLELLMGDPLLKSLESDPRYAAFLKKMRLPS